MISAYSASKNIVFRLNKNSERLNMRCANIPSMPFVQVFVDTPKWYRITLTKTDEAGNNANRES